MTRLARLRRSTVLGAIAAALVPIVAGITSGGGGDFPLLR